MKLSFNRFLATSIAAVAALSSSAWAVDVIKDNNTNALNLGTSWLNDGLLGDITPATSPGHIAVWNSTVTGANSSALGASLSWEGIKIVDPGGAVTVTHSSGQTLTLGASGIDMSAATQNLNLLSSDAAVNLAIDANQTWNIASSRTLTLFETDNAKNERLTGSGNIEVTGGGIVRMLVGDAGSTSFTAGNGNDTYTGNWTITNGSVRSLRNGTHAWGQGTINLNGGTIGQEQGSWTWSNAIQLNSSTTSTIDDFNTSGTTRSLKLQGVISGDGNINFNDSSNRMGSDTGYILTGTNTMSGTITLGANADVRVGGVTGNDTTAGSGTGGTLGTAGVNLSATTSTLTFSRSDTHTVSNVISGSGAVRIGGGVSGTSSQVITLSGANTYTGPTTLSNGTLKTTHLTALGTGTVNVNGGTLDLDANLTIGSLAGSASTVDSGNFTLTLNTASNSGTFYTGTFASTGSVVLRGGSHTVQDNSTGATGAGAGNFFILQTVGIGTAFHLDTGSSATNRRDFGWTNDTGSVLTLNSLQGHGALRGDAGTPTGGVRNIVVNQATDTTFDGSILSHTSGAGVLRSMTLTKQGSGTLTLAGFIGEQTATAGSGADVVNLTVEGGLLDVTNSANGTATNGTAGTMTVTGGILAFSNNALGKGGAGSVVMNGGTLRWNSGNTQDLTVSSRLTLVAGKTATLDTNGNNVVLSNALGGGAINASLTKTGTGSLTLEGSNAYTGNTLVSNGTLVINGSVSTGTVTVASGASLMGSGTIGGATTIDAGATLSPGESPGLLTIEDALTLNGTTLMELGGQTLGSGYDSIAVSGLLTYGGILNIVSHNSYNLAQAASYTLFGLGGGETGTFSSVTVGGLSLAGASGVWSAEDSGLTYTFTESTGQLVVIPEPAAALLGGIGMLILLRRRRAA